MPDEIDNRIPEQPSESETANAGCKRRRIRKPIIIGLIAALIAGSLWWCRAPIRDLFGIRTQVEFDTIESDEFLKNAAEQMGVTITPPGQIDFSNLTILRDEILSGASKDGILALTQPHFDEVKKATSMRPSDRVISIVLNHEARAFPLRILERHEIVNDHVGGVPVVVTYCPLCDSAAAFDRRIDDQVLEFGVSGFLYKSNMLLYDRHPGASESLWSQIMGAAVCGPQSGKKLKVLPAELVNWSDWKSRYPDGEVVSFRTGFDFKYAGGGYADVLKGEKLFVPVEPFSKRFSTKERLLGVWTDGKYRAYPISAFKSSAEPVEITDDFAGKKLTLGYNSATKSLRIVKADDGIEWMYAHWFAWYAFHPDTEVYQRQAD